MSPFAFAPPIKLLVVENREVDRDAIRRCLAVSGSSVTLDELSDAGDVVARAAASSYDCIILDGELPDEPAAAVIERLRAAAIWTPILCMTGPDEDGGASMMAADASDFLPKVDLSPSRLARRLRYVLRLERAERHARHVRDELDAHRRLLGAVIAQLPTGVVVTDPTARQVLVSNERAQGVVGVDGVELLAAAPSPSVQQARDALTTALATRAMVTLDGPFAHDGRELRIGAAPVVADGRILAAMIVFDDITDEVEARRAAERAAHAREQVLAIVSHDLRGPLSAISVALDGIRDPTLDAVARERYIAAVQRSIDRADRLISDLMTAHEIEVGRLRVDPGPVGVRSLLEHVARDHELLVAQAQSKLVILIDERVDKVLADRDRVSQALANLIGNALRHARGTSTIELVAAPADGGGVELCVRDHGPGISDDALPHVFDRYWQGRERRGGSGLGLAIVRGIARAHGGDATVAHAPGGGALFTMRLPARAP